MIRRACLLGAFALAVACGSGGTTTDAGGGSGGGFGGTGGGTGTGGGSGGSSGSLADLNAFCAAFSNKLCESLVACNRMETNFKDSCVSIYSSSLCRDSRQSVSSGEVSFDKAKLNSCTASINAATPSCDNTFDLYGNNPDCYSTSDGLVPTGGQCDQSGDCAAPGDRCNLPADAGSECAGTCGPNTSTAGGLNQPCFGANVFSCNTGFWCDVPANTCRAPKPAGGSCTSSSSYECDRLTTACNTTTMQCTQLPAPGQACATTLNPSCDSAGYCVFGTPATCVARGGQDAGCTSATQCQQNFYCTTTTPRHCEAQGPSGAACAAQTECQSGLRCTVNQCRAPGGEGAVCRSGADCVTGLGCDDVSYTCREFKSVTKGQPCSSSTSCTDSWCSGVVRTTDGGVGQTGTCTDVYLGRPCSSHSSCQRATYCERADGGSTGAGACATNSSSGPCTGQGNCVATSYCGATQTCTPRGNAGGSCDPTDDDSCLEQYRCIAQSSTATVGSCGIPGSTGTPCFVDGVHQCKIPNECINGSCALVGANGQPCNDEGICFNGECAGGNVDAGVRGTCGAALPDGASCDSDFDCVSLFCDGRAARCASVCQ